MIVYDGLEFKDESTFVRYKRLRTRLRIFSTLSVAIIFPSFLLFFSSYFFSSSTTPPTSSYVYLAPLAVGLVFSFISIRANSRITEIINSDDVRHV